VGPAPWCVEVVTRPQDGTVAVGLGGPGTEASIRRSAAGHGEYGSRPTRGTERDECLRIARPPGGRSTCTVESVVSAHARPCAEHRRSTIRGGACLHGVLACHRPLTRLVFLAPAVVAVALALATPAAAAGASPRIVNGRDAAIEDHPYQVALWDPSRGTPSPGQFCGGVILDATRILTAAHCLVDKGDLVGSPRGVDVLAGTADLSSGGTSVPAATLAVDDRYDPATNDHDIGIVQLSTPLWTGPDPAIDDTTVKIAPIPIISDPVFQSDLDGLEGNTPTPITTTVSGWGYDQPVDPSSAPTDPRGFPHVLQTVDVPLIAQTTCENDFMTSPNITPIAGLTLFCAGDDSDASNLNNKDSCSGDSGGPLVIDPDQTAPHTDVELAGVVDSGFGCAWYHLPGIYTRVSALTDLIDASDPQLDPSEPPTVSGTPQVGQVLTCNHGAWTGSPTFLYRFYRESSSGPVALSSQSASSTYTPGQSDANTNLFCEVQASENSSHAQRTADSADVAVALAPVVSTVPATGSGPSAQDTKRPTLRVTSKKCTRTRCTVKVRVTDPPPSAGIRTVRASLHWTQRVACGRSSRAGRAARTCPKKRSRALAARAWSGGVFTIVARKLRPATRYSFTLRAVDKAGHVQRPGTHTRVRTKPPKKRRR
jgi:secreted trypsin-like serine protease